MYPSPGHSLLIIPQPGHAGNGTEFSKTSISSVSICVIFGAVICWTALTNKIDSRGTFARVVAPHQPEQQQAHCANCGKFIPETCFINGTVILSGAQRSRSRNAADGVGRAGLSIPCKLPSSQRNGIPRLSSG